MIIVPICIIKLRFSPDLKQLARRNAPVLIMVRAHDSTSKTTENPEGWNNVGHKHSFSRSLFLILCYALSPFFVCIDFFVG